MFKDLILFTSRLICFCLSAVILLNLIDNKYGFIERKYSFNHCVIEVLSSFDLTFILKSLNVFIPKNVDTWLSPILFGKLRIGSWLIIFFGSFELSE